MTLSVFWKRALQIIYLMSELVSKLDMYLESYFDFENAILLSDYASLKDVESVRNKQLKDSGPLLIYCITQIVHVICRL